MNLTLHVTTACQLRCSYCYVRPDRLRHGEMSAATARTAIEFAARRSPDHCGVVFFGGEPLLCRDLIRETVAYCRWRQQAGGPAFHFKVTTNGVALDDEFLDFAVAEDVFVAISLDGVPEAHDRHRRHPGGGGSWAQVDAAARRLLARRPYSPVLMVVSPDTVEHYAESVRYLVELGFRYVVASLDYTGPWDTVSLRRLRRQYRRLADLYEAWTREERKFYFSPFEVKLDSHIHGDRYRHERCELGRRQLSVAPNGGIYPCVQFVQDGTGEEFRVGDVQAGVDEERLAAIAQRVESERTPCRECAIAGRCNHTCGCLNWQATGRLDAVSPVLCAHERLLMPIVDRLGERLYRRRSPLFVQKHYNALYPLLSLIEDRGKQNGSRRRPGRRRAPRTAR